MARTYKSGAYLLENTRKSAFFSDDQLLKKLILYSQKFFPNSSFKRLDAYHDEPKIFQYSARFLKKFNGHKIVMGGVGTSFSENKARIKASGEFIERGALANTNIRNNKNEVLKLPVANLENLCEFNSDVNRNILNNKKLDWITGYDLKTLEKIRVPSQLVFVPYKFKKGEPIIRQPISTGAAAGINYPDAILRAVLEVIERDAFVISYYDKKVNSKIDISKDHRLRNILDEIKRCELELNLFDISTDTGPYVFLSLILDKTSFGPPISAGLKAGFNPYKVAIGSIEESLHSRTWIRDIMFDTKYKKQRGNIVTILDRALYWLNPKLLKNLGFYFDLKKSKKLTLLPNKELPLKKQLTKLLNNLIKNKTNIFTVDLTQNTSSPLKVVKVIIPELQPLYLDERYSIFGNRVHEKNKNIPHFFL